MNVRSIPEKRNNFILAYVVINFLRNQINHDFELTLVPTTFNRITIKAHLTGHFHVHTPIRERF